MWIFVEASLICSCWMSVLTATKSTWVMPASIMRSTAFSPAPPTPTTRMTARYDAWSRARSRRAGCSGSGSSQRAMRRSSTGDGSGSGSGSGAGATARIGVGAGGSLSRAAGGGESGGSSVGSCCCSSCGSAFFCPWRCAASVARKSSASGPSRMLARFLAIEHLLREVAVHPRCLPCRFVRENGGALDGGLCEANGLPNPRVVDEIAEVLAQDLVCLARVRDALVEHRRDDADDLDLRVQVLAHHRERVLELHETAQGEVLGLHGNDDPRRRDEGVDRQQPERRRRVDEDEVVAVTD